MNDTLIFLLSFAVVLALTIIITLLYFIVFKGERKTTCNKIFNINVDNMQKILSIYGDIFFEYDMASNKLNFSPNIKPKIGIDDSIDLHYERIKLTKTIHKEDYLKVKEMMLAVLGEKTAFSKPIRLLEKSGNFKWHQISVSPILNEKNQVIKIIGVAANIDSFKKETEIYKEKAIRDPLTGFYNKIETERLIENYINNEGALGRQALLFIDIDDFKSINDLHGHLFGDTVLSEVAIRLKRIFRSTDIVGRMGGDEFLIFIKNIESRSRINEKVGEIRFLLKNEYCEGNLPYPVTASVGVAIYPENGRNYLELIKSADDALYRAKNSGKDKVVISNDRFIDKAK